VVRKDDPGRLVDVLIVGAFIEARSCERFAKIAPHLDSELKPFYQSLLKSEARHYQDYLALATKAAGNESIDQRIAVISACERRLIQDPDVEFRFHSGDFG
jgi:tRNA-(ms[2]io[6]A)-hydroxylase